MAVTMLVPLRSVFSTRPASFVTVASLDDAVRRLAVVVKPSVWQEWAVDCLIGRVSADHVEVRRHRAGSRDPLPAVFVGAFSTDGDNVVLAGHFRHSTASRVLLVAALAIFGVLFAASTLFGGVLVTSTQSFAQKVGAGIFIGALMIVSALALWRSTQPLTEEDISGVSAGIQKALDTPSNKPFHLTPGLAPYGRSVRRR
jgi:hypothetical protein